MATPRWAPATIYAPGDIVQPMSGAAPTVPTLSNPTFDSGSTDWTLSGAAAWSASNGFTTPGCIQVPGGGIGSVFLTALTPCSPGQVITAQCQIATPNGSAGSGGDVNINWYDASDVFISQSQGNTVNRAGGTGYRPSTVTAAAPPGAVKYTIGADCQSAGGGIVRVDNFSVSTAGGATNGLVYRAVQAAPGLSGGTEPAWPATAGVQVVDNQVTWEAVYATRVEWTAHPLLVSGSTEPTWPTSIGGSVIDGSVNWTAQTQEIADPNCPHSRAVTILASKVFAGDDDITRYCATLNAKDWSTIEDAGFLPTGMQGANCNGVTVLNQYRGNLAFFNPEVFQNWIADPDPQVMARIDLIPGIGSSYQTAAQSVVNDLFMLTPRGFRTVTVSASSENLQGGDVGEPVDPLVRALLALIDDDDPGYGIASAFFPGLGQFLASFQGYPTATETTVMAFTMRGRKGAWSRYVYPFLIDSFAQLGDKLYLLAESDGAAIVCLMDESYHVDDVVVDGAVDQVAFPGKVAWNFLDNGTPGFTKELEAFDYIGEGQAPSFSIAFDQRNAAVFTTPYQLPTNDTLPGAPYPMPVSAPTMSPVLDFAGGEAWRVMSMTMYFFDVGGEP